MKCIDRLLALQTFERNSPRNLHAAGFAYYNYATSRNLTDAAQARYNSWEKLMVAGYAVL